MARKAKKTLEVQKFGGVENRGTVRDENITAFRSEMSGQTYTHQNTQYDLQDIEVQSDTKLEDDTGQGGAAIVRMFAFGMNPIAFAQYRPTNQELFNSHYKGIEAALWKDGMKVLPDVNPRVVIDEKKQQYMIFVGAAPQKGHLLKEKPQTLTEIAHGGSTY